MLQLVKKNTTDPFSTGDGSDPIVTDMSPLDDSGTPATIESEVLNVEILATDYEYSTILLEIISEEAGIDYKLSLDNVSFVDTLTVPDIDASGADQRVDVYIKTVVANDGSVSAGSYAAPDIRLTRTENQ
jgi:hypothetical protein